MGSGEGMILIFLIVHPPLSHPYFLKYKEIDHDPPPFFFPPPGGGGDSYIYDLFTARGKDIVS